MWSPQKQDSQKIVADWSERPRVQLVSKSRQRLVKWALDASPSDWKSSKTNDTELSTFQTEVEIFRIRRSNKAIPVTQQTTKNQKALFERISTSSFQESHFWKEQMGIFFFQFIDAFPQNYISYFPTEFKPAIKQASEKLLAACK